MTHSGARGIKGFKTSCKGGHFCKSIGAVTGLQYICWRSSVGVESSLEDDFKWCTVLIFDLRLFLLKAFFLRKRVWWGVKLLTGNTSSSWESLTEKRFSLILETERACSSSGRRTASSSSRSTDNRVVWAASSPQSLWRLRSMHHGYHGSCLTCYRMLSVNTFTYSVLVVAGCIHCYIFARPKRPEQS